MAKIEYLIEMREKISYGELQEQESIKREFSLPCELSSQVSTLEEQLYDPEIMHRFVSIFFIDQKHLLLSLYFILNCCR